jgi:Family of unknown function (DUF6350)
MLQRVLAVSFAQVLRSVFVILLPLAFIALIAWATAGSISGNTSDPIRAALWLWLGAHHLPFFLSGQTNGYLSFLPIGALLVPFFALRLGFGRALSKLHGDFHNINSVRTIFASQYALVATLLALVSRSSTVAPQWYLTPIITFAIAYLACLTAGSRFRMSQAVSLASRVIAILVGAAFIVLALQIFTNISTFKNISIVLQPGIFGSLLLFALNLFYLPNAALAVLGYFTGTGFAVGTGTLVSPLTHRLGELPALPLLSALPTTSSRWALLAVLLVISVGALLALWAQSSSTMTLFQSFFLIVISTLFLSYLASGSLMTPAMSAVGLSIWKFPLSIALEIAIGAALIIFLPQIRIRSKR